MSQNDVLTTRQAARQLGVSVRTIQLWVEGGLLPAWKTAGGHRRIAREAIETLVRERAQALDSVPAGPAYKVLVVEDEASLRELYKVKLGSWGLPMEILMATNGYEALLSIGHRQPDLLVTDLSMPAMDGFRMLRTLKSLPEYDDLDIIVVTALDEAEIEDRGGLPPGVRVFQKPVPFAALEAHVREHYAARARVEKNP